MLTSDLVRPYRRGKSMKLTPLVGKKYARALELAGLCLTTFQQGVGGTREALDAVLDELSPTASELLHWRGMARLIAQKATFETAAPIEPIELRARVFQEAARARTAAAQAGEPFDRDAVLDAVARTLEVDRSVVDAGLFADLKGAEKLVALMPESADELTRRYELGRVQAVLLKAERLDVELTLGRGGFSMDESVQAALRELVGRLKFLQLMFRIEHATQGLVLTIDGPMSVFSGATRYGLKFASALPMLLAAGDVKLSAPVTWGKTRSRSTFTFDSRDFPWLPEPPPLPPVAEHVQKLVADINKQKGFSATLGEDVFQVPGVGVCAPDVAVIHEKTGQLVYIDVLGFWSRDAVWRRVEMVERGLDVPTIFAVSDRLRVDKDALKAESARLYVYKGVMRAKALCTQVAELAGA